MPEIRVTVGSRIGLHARPAALVAKAAASCAMPVLIGRTAADGVNAASVLALMSLGVQAGEEVVIVAEGEGAQAAVETLGALVARDLDAAETAT
jgi:phosphocarrier protein